MEIPTTISPLLSDEVIERVRAQSRDNRLGTKRKRTYPLAHLVRCGNCNSVLCGHALSGTNWVYYRHHSKTKKPECMIAVRADALEQQVVGDLWKLLKNTKSLRKSIEDALNVANSERGELEAEKAQLAARLASIEREQGDLEEAATKAPAMANRLNDKYAKLEDSKASLIARCAEIERQLPDLRIPKDLAERVEEIFGKLARAGGPMHWRPEQQKELAQLVIGGPIHWRRPEDKGRGIFLKAVERDGEKFWEYEINGALVVGAGSVGAEQEGNREWSYESPTPVGQIPVPALVAIAKQVKTLYSVPRFSIRGKW